MLASFISDRSPLTQTNKLAASRGKYCSALTLASIDKLTAHLYKVTMVNKPDLFRYLTKQNDDWGVNLTTIGYHHAAPGSAYPPAGHPETHAFDWKSGRKLNEYHMVYVPTGAGLFET